MRATTYLTMLAAPLALAACGGGNEAADTEGSTMAETGQPAQTASGEGTVTAIDADAGTITIDHGPVAAVNWPAMTMAFQADEAQRQKVAVGDNVTFEFHMAEGGGEIVSISKK